MKTQVARLFDEPGPTGSVADVVAPALAPYTLIDGCRSCGAKDLEVFLSLGMLPLANALTASREEAITGAQYPLRVAFCRECTLVQILETVEPQILYQRNYPYFSSFSERWVAHCERNAKDLMKEHALGSRDLVVELASNDGSLLRWFREGGVPVLGIDPAGGPAQVATDRGIPTVVDFFTRELAVELRNAGTRASMIIGNNVLAHVPDQNDFVAGVSTLLDSDGVAVFEFPYVGDLIEHGEFDTIYHEHHCYFSVHAVQRLFARHYLQLTRVDHLETHGGSLRCQFTRQSQVDPSVNDFLDRERAEGMVDFSYYRDFGERVEDISRHLRALLVELKSHGSRVAAYGAAAKGATLLNYAQIGDDLIEYVVDRNRYKQGWYMPGAGLEVRDPQVLQTEQPDYTLLLAWNHAPEIAEQLSPYLEQGGRFIVPIPWPRVIEAPLGNGREADLLEVGEP